MKAGVIAGLALLWRLLVWIWSILIIGIIVGVLGNAAYTYITTGKLDVIDPRTLPLLQWARIHFLLLTLILLGVLVLTLCAWLAYRHQKKVAQESLHTQKEAQYEQHFEAPSQGIVIGEHNTVTIYGQIPLTYTAHENLLSHAGMFLSVVIRSLQDVKNSSSAFMATS